MFPSNNKIILQCLVLITVSKYGLAESNGTICSICNCSKRDINCRNHGLNQSFDAAAWSQIGKSDYTEAIFDNNHIGHIIRLPSLPLVKLSYKNNRIVKIDDRAFRNLTKLEELDLSDNEITSNNLLPVVFEGPYDPEFYDPLKIKLLDLSGNELHTLHQDLFEHLPLLERLYLKGNPFKILDKPTVIAISSIPNLEVLDLSSTRLKELPSGFLHTPRKLHELVLKGNLFTEVPDDVLVESHDLRILNLNENPIRVLSSERPFPDMPSLKQLHISFMPNLTRIENGSLAGLTGLDYLYCRMNERLSYISPAAFTRNDGKEVWPNIVKLDLSDNALRYLDHDLLKPVWKKIRHINIMGNPWVCDCENQWIVSELVPLMINISAPVDGLHCEEPSPMKGQRLATLYAKNYTMRCLDLYGNHPENDGPILVSIFVIVILTLIIILGVVIWLRNNNTCRQGGRVNYHRAFYRPTKLEDPDKY